MDPVPIHFAKTHLSRLIQRAQAGEEVVIARGKAPVVRLVPVTAEQPRRQFGAMRDRVSVDDTFFEPLPEQELAAWEGAEPPAAPEAAPQARAPRDRR